MERDKELAIIRFLSQYGHLKFPFGREQDLPTDVETLTLRDEAVQEAVRSHQNLDANYMWLAGAVHGRSAIADGDVGPVTEYMILEQPRCGHPDYAAVLSAEPAQGSGNWRGCHSVGNFHAASIKVTNSPPDFLAPHWSEVKSRVTKMYAELGLLFHWDGRSPHQTALSFVGSSSGWIGLALVVNGMSCGESPIWLRLLATYRGGSSEEQIIRQWTTLTAHELGHNCGEDHTRGGVLNPSIVNGLPGSWKGDPAEPNLKRKFGGEAIPGAEPPLPPPPLPPGPPDSVVISGGLVINNKKFIVVPDPLYSSI